MLLHAEKYNPDLITSWLGEFLAGKCIGTVFPQGLYKTLHLLVGIYWNDICEQQMFRE